jgi:hypothetical protein
MKPKLHPTKVYANFCDGFVEAHASKEFAKQECRELRDDIIHGVVPCLLIPLNPKSIQELQSKVAKSMVCTLLTQGLRRELPERLAEACFQALGIRKSKRKP